MVNARVLVNTNSKEYCFKKMHFLACNIGSGQKYVGSDFFIEYFKMFILLAITRVRRLHWSLNGFSISTLATEIIFKVKSPMKKHQLSRRT